MPETNEFSFVAVDADTGLPTPVTLSRETLRSTLMTNPDILTEIIKGAISQPVNEIDKTRVGGRLPSETKITDMLDPQRVQRLSPAARRLTKENLIELGGWDGTRKTATELGLAVKDIQTIREVFGQGMRPGAVDSTLAIDVSCCCCTPCCCAAAQTRPKQKVA